MSSNNNPSSPAPRFTSEANDERKSQRPEQARAQARGGEGRKGQFARQKPATAGVFLHSVLSSAHRAPAMAHTQRGASGRGRRRCAQRRTGAREKKREENEKGAGAALVDLSWVSLSPSPSPSLSLLPPPSLSHPRPFLLPAHSVPGRRGRDARGARPGRQHPRRRRGRRGRGALWRWHGAVRACVRCARSALLCCLALASLCRPPVPLGLGLGRCCPRSARRLCSPRPRASRLCRSSPLPSRPLPAPSSRSALVAAAGVSVLHRCAPGRARRQHALPRRRCPSFPPRLAPSLALSRVPLHKFAPLARLTPHCPPLAHAPVAHIFVARDYREIERLDRYDPAMLDEAEHSDLSLVRKKPARRGPRLCSRASPSARMS